MHASSLENMQKCFDKYVKKWQWDESAPLSVMDIGGVNVNGTYADIFSGSEFIYKAVDIEPDEDVDIVLADPYKFPFEDDSVDIVISGQAFEHVEFFWELFGEMVRVLKKDGLIILIAPSSGPIHSFPVDCYRFYPDSFRALAKYTNCTLIDVRMDYRGPWNDLIGVFCKCSLAEAGALLGAESTRVWQANRCELELPDGGQFEKNENEAAELIQGDINYIEVLGRLHLELDPEFYLEIGVRQGTSFQLSNCKSLGIDPQFDIKVELADNHELVTSTSDKFFEDIDHGENKVEKVDLAFIDGMHLFEFAFRDFINVERISSPHTVVVIDDISPNHPIQAQRERASKVWTGDVWKLAQCLKENRPDLNLTILNSKPTGLLIITGLNRENSVLLENYNPLVRKYKQLTLGGDLQEHVVNRSGSIESMHMGYWNWLTQFVIQVKNAPNIEKLVLANSLTKEWRLSLS